MSRPYGRLAFSLEGALVVVVAVHTFDERFQRAPVLAKGTMEESCPQTSI